MVLAVLYASVPLDMLWACVVRFHTGRQKILVALLLVASDLQHYA